MLNRIIKLVLSIAFIGLKGVIKPLKRKGDDNRTLICVTYHSVKTEEISKFAKHMDELMKAGNPALADTDVALEAGENFIAVTFDDGFQSFMQHALPVLLEKGIPVTVFVPTNWLGERAGWITREDHRNFEELVMTREQIGELSRYNTLVGSHSATHRRLNGLPRHEVLDELERSKRDLEKIVGKEVDLFSFPYGSCDDEIISISKAIGYKRLFLNVPRKKESDLKNYIFGRINMSLDDWPIEYKLKFRGAYNWLCYGVALKRRLKTVFRNLPTKGCGGWMANRP